MADQVTVLRADTSWRRRQDKKKVLYYCSRLYILGSNTTAVVIRTYGRTKQYLYICTRLYNLGLYTITNTRYTYIYIYLDAHHEGSRVSLPAVKQTDPLQTDVGIVDVEVLPRVLAGADCLGELVHLKNETKNGQIMVFVVVVVVVNVVVVVLLYSCCCGGDNN